MDDRVQIGQTIVSQFSTGTLAILILAFALFAGNSALLFRYMPGDRKLVSSGENGFLLPFPWLVGSLIAVTSSMVAGVIVLGSLPNISGEIVRTVTSGRLDPFSIGGAGRIPRVHFWSVAQYVFFAIAVLTPTVYFTSILLARAWVSESLSNIAPSVVDDPKASH